MQPLTIPAYAVANGAMPSIGTCALHGRPMVGARGTTFKGKPPPWVWLLLLAGVLIALLVAEAVRPKVTGPVPECELCIAERQARKRKLRVLWVGTAVLFIATLAASEYDEFSTLCTILALVTLAAFIWTLIAAIRAERKALQGTVSKDGQWVTVNVEDGHFLAVQQAMASAARSTPAT